MYDYFQLMDYTLPFYIYAYYICVYLYIYIHTHTRAYMYIYEMLNNKYNAAANICIDIQKAFIRCWIIRF